MVDYVKTASLVIKRIGGKDNIKSVTHRATRSRFWLRDNGLRDEGTTSDLEGVKGVFLIQSQSQTTSGSDVVDMVCDEVQKQLGTLEEKPEEKEEGEENVVQRFIKMLSDIFVPVTPTIVVGGLLMGLNNLLTSPLINGRPIIAPYSMWQGLASAINTFANAPFTLPPVLIGFSTTRKFGGNTFLGVAMSMIMVHPDLLDAYQIGLAQPPVWDISGFQIAVIGYQGTVLPALAVSWALANIEKQLRKMTPSWLDSLTTPLLSILVTLLLTFISVGPVLRETGNLLTVGTTWLYNTLGPAGGALFESVYAPIAMTGICHSFIAVEAQLLADSAYAGGSFIFSTASMSNMAQGAAVPAVPLTTKNDRMESIYFASGISALLGITEPAIFGVTLKLEYPFYAIMAGSAAGSAYLTATKTLMQVLGATGFLGFISMRPNHYMNSTIGTVLSMGVSFALIMVFWKRFALDQQDRTEKGTGSRAGEIEEASGTEMPRKIVTQLYVLMKGQILGVGQSADEVFVSKAPGSGVVIDPVEGMVRAPCDGIINLLLPTKHVMRITSEAGAEVPIHIGTNTVQLDGRGFETFVFQGDKAKKGGKLIAADLDLIREKEINPQTMMILPEGGNPDVTVYPGEQADAKIVTVKAVKIE